MNNKETIEHRRYWINLFKMSRGCSICGYDKHPSALCFDHLNTNDKHEMTKNGCSKRNHAGGMFMLYGKKYSNDVLLDEILKCRILCHNCHMEQTHNKRPIPNKPMYGMSYQELEFNLKNEVQQIDL
jgi:hypothetical protein